MCKVKCLNPISKVGTDSLLGHYELTDDINEAEAVLVRSADMKSMEIPEKVIAVARATSRWTDARNRASWYSILPAQTPTV